MLKDLIYSPCRLLCMDTNKYHAYSRAEQDVRIDAESLDQKSSSAQVQM
uniref:Uncharacterized protein n=1 Tax=Arundo donax TaxID=35708 RepID=A0A0A9DPK8_ARUDO